MIEQDFCFTLFREVLWHPLIPTNDILIFPFDESLPLQILRINLINRGALIKLKIIRYSIHE
jgi:hypothetical protein